MTRRPDEAPLRARVPADIDRPDTIAFGMSWRQLVILAVTGLVLYAAWTALSAVVPVLYFIAAAIPVGGAVFFLAAGRRDGISLDRWLLAALRHHRTPHHLVPAEEPMHPAPAWVATTAGPGDRLPLPAPLRLPATRITEHGLIDLGPDGTTALVDASTVAFGLRTTQEQNSLVGGFARWLHSLDGPAQIVVRAHRVDLTYLAQRITDHAPELPHPALERAALAHAEFLTDLAAGHELLHRQVTVAVRSTHSPAHTLHRAADTVRGLSACEVTASVLDPARVAATLAASIDPTTPNGGRVGEDW